MLARLILLAAAWAPLVAAQSECYNYGQGSPGSCVCPAGFTTPQSDNCNLPTCGGSLYEPGGAGAGTMGNLSSCGCTDGWAGPGCTVCETPNACVSSLNRYLNSSTALATSGVNSTMLCSSEPTVYSASHMSCSVIQKTLQSLFPLDSTLTISRFLNASRTPGGTSVLGSAGIANGDNEVWAQLWYNSVEQFFCHAQECQQTITGGDSGTNSSEWVCGTLNCTCRPGTDFCGGGSASVSQNLTAVINVLEGPLTIDCEGGGVCHFKQEFLNRLFGSNGLQLSSCKHGECVQQFVVDEAMGITTAAGGGNGLSGGVIAGLAVVGAFVLAIILVLIWGFIMRRKARAAASDGTLTKHGGVGLAWTGVGYEVRPHGRGLYATTMSWLRGRGVRSGSAESGAAAGPHGGRVVLRDACGDIPPGGFCCIIGPSGAGKSTLVDILAGKRKAGHVEGKVAYVDDSKERRRVKVGYCDQSDVLAPTSTVLETLQFAARLRLPENVPTSVKDERARTVMNQLGLADIANSRVGSGESRGVSGGEQRRISIGVELVANPDVLVLDEPTSGLDSVSAARIVNLLKSLADDPEQRTTIIASIHQPSSALYHSFSQVLLLANGKQLYFGPGGNAPVEFFAKAGRQIPPGYNVADYLLEIASGSSEGLLTGSAAMVGGMRSASSDGTSRDPSEEEKSATPYPPNQLSRSVTGQEVDLAALADSDRNKREWFPKTHCSTTFLTQMGCLAKREWRNLLRDKTLFFAHFALACALALFSGGLYINIDLSIAGFQNRVGCLFFLGALIAFLSLTAVNTTAEARPLFLRERSGNFYSPMAWLLSRVLFDIVPLRIIPTAVLGIIVYFMVGLSRHPAEFFKFLLALLLFSITITLYYTLLALSFAHASVATLLSALYCLSNLLYSGFFINLAAIPAVLRWVKNIMPLSFTLEALTVNEVAGGLQVKDVLGGVPVEISATILLSTLFGFDLSHYYRNILVACGFLVGFGLLCMIVTIWWLREKR